MSRRIEGVAKEIMETLARMGEVLASPTMGRVVEIMGTTREERSSKRTRQKYQKAMWRLKRSRLIILREKPDGTAVVKLTERGKRKIREFRLWDLAIPIPKSWDGKYRLVIFDIPKKYEKMRHIFTRKLMQLGLYSLQKSVWIFPYPCTAEIEFLAEYLGLNRNIRIIEANSISQDVPIKKHFRLFT